jgi:hypothetical protein
MKPKILSGGSGGAQHRHQDLAKNGFTTEENVARAGERRKSGPLIRGNERAAEKRPRSVVENDESHPEALGSGDYTPLTQFPNQAT